MASRQRTWPENIWIAAEAPEGPEPERAALEALAQARSLTRNLGSGVRVLLLAGGAVPRSQIEVWHRRGADRVAVLTSPGLSAPDVRVRVEAVAAALELGQPQVVLVVASPSADAWAVRLATRRRLPVVTRCIEVTASSERLRARRETFRGAVHLTLEFPRVDAGVERHGPAILVMEPGSWALPPESAPAQSEAENLALPATVTEEQVHLVRQVLPDPGEINLQDAELVLAGGAGLGSAEGFAELRAVARQLGAAAGASRVAVDRGWARPEEQVGLTGQQVAPRVYVALGISGAREHLAGVTEAQTIVAVNTDRSAPIVSASQVCAPADARAVLSALAAEVDRRSAADSQSQEVGSHGQRG